MNIKNYLLYMVLATFSVACAPEEENLFDDSSANRADTAIKSTIEILTSASNGWVLEYFPESTQKYGGYNLILAFDKDGVVKVASDHSRPSDVATSFYSVKQSAGILLSLDTYNPIFHFFSDPSDPSGQGSKGYGLEGDYDFLFLETSAEKIVLKGKKSGSIATMTPLIGDWISFLTKIQHAESAMSFNKINLVLDGEEIPVSFSNRTMTFNYKEDGDELSQTASFIVTETGYKFYTPVIIKGATLHGFTFDPVNVWFTETQNASIKLIPELKPLNVQFVEGNWYIALSTIGEFAKPHYLECKKNFLDVWGETLKYASIGVSIYEAFGFNFESGFSPGFLGFDYKLVGSDKVSLLYNRTGYENGPFYLTAVGFDSLLFPFGYEATRTFTLTTDNIYKPSYITLTEDANPTNVITLHKARIMDPFEN